MPFYITNRAKSLKFYFKIGKNRGIFATKKGLMPYCHIETATEPRNKDGTVFAYP